MTSTPPSVGRATRPVVPAPRTAPGAGTHPDPVLLGRQSIFTAGAERYGCELLFRSPRPRPVPVDQWSPRDQDLATRHVIEAALGCGLTHLGGSRPVFVNATRALLLGELVPPMPRQMGIEVVETLEVDQAVLEGVIHLRSRGHLISVDDFTGRSDQVRLLPYADIVKIDLRDLVEQGIDLLRQAQSCGGATVVERVETREQLDRCIDLGFDLFQGNLLEPALVLEVGRGWSYPRDADATRSTARSTAKTGSRPAPFTSASA